MSLHHGSNDYMAHGFCFAWEPGLVWLHVISDVVTGMAYYSIPVAMFYFIAKRRDLPFYRMFLLFGTFILACGTTHFFAAYTIYEPLYWPEGWVKAVTALVSAYSALLFIPMIPKAIALPSLTKALDEIKGLNAALEKQVEELAVKDSAIASSITAMFFADLDGRLTYANQAYQELMGFGRDQSPLGRAALEFCQSQDDAPAITEALRRDGKWVGELSMLRRDGTTLSVELVCNIVRGKAQQPVCIMGSFTDITERKQAERKLQESEERFRSVVNNIPIGVTVISPEMRVISANPQMYRWFPELDTGTLPVCFQVFNNPPREEVCGYCPVHLTLGDGEVHEAVTDTPTPEGTNHYRVISSPIRDVDGKIVAAIELVEDFTAREKLEAQLRHSQKMESVGTLAGGIAHDFNNILTVIIGYGSLLDMKMEKGNPLALHVHQILAAAERATSLTQSLLAFSRKTPVEMKPVDLNALISKVEHLLARLLREDIEFECTLSENSLMVMADASQLEQVLVNLATNARDAMPNGGLLRISTSILELDREFIHAHGFGKSGRYALLACSDNGVGMDRETAQRIFEPFFTTKEVGKGTGLGLSITYGIIKQHNGYVNCYSEPGEGTTFRVYLPLTESVPNEEPKMAEASPRGGTETILVAEDDVVVRNLTRQILESSGYHVVEAVDGDDAISAFLRHREQIRLVMLDVIMPKRSGREACEEIVKLEPQMKCLLASGYAADLLDEADLNKFYFLPKPIIPSQLLKKVREMLDE